MDKRFDIFTMSTIKTFLNSLLNVNTLWLWWWNIHCTHFRYLSNNLGKNRQDWWKS